MKKLLMFFMMPLVALSIGGCVTTPQGQELSPAGKVLLQESAGIAVRRYLRDRPNAQARVNNIREIVTKVQAVTEAVTIADLKAVVVREISARVTNDLDRADALALVNVLYVVLLERVGEDRLDVKALVRVNEVLSYVLAALPPG